MESRLWRELLAVFLFSVGFLALELSYTKLLSVVLWYHFGFLMVSTAMLGFAASGAYLAVRREGLETSLFALIVRAAVAALAGYVLFTRLDLTGARLDASAATLTTLLVVTGLLVVPFFFMGLTITWILARRKERVGAVYGANLLGSALGALFFIALFDHVRGEIAVVATSLLMLLAASFVIERRSQAVTWAVLVALVTPLLFLGDLFPIEPPREKWLGKVRNRAEATRYSSWSSLARVDVFADPDRNLARGVGLWGLSLHLAPGRPRPALPERLGVTIDSFAITSILKYPQNLDFYDFMPTTFVYQLGRQYESSLHIGAGGGLDLIAAHHHGVPEIDGVEINSLIVRAVQEQFDEYTGGLYTGGIEGVRIHVDEGRSFLERSRRKYDLIQLSGVDTSSSTQAGAFALSENYLYTADAFVSYLEHLEEGGMLTLMRWYAPDTEGNPTFSLRLVSVLREALEQLGIEPEGRVFFFRDSPVGPDTVLAVQLDPFTPEQVKRGMDFVRRLRGVPMIVPGRRLGNIWETFLYAPTGDYETRLASYPYRVGAPDDDSPFFFEVQRFGSAFGRRGGIWGSHGITGQQILFAVLAELAVLGVLILALPLTVVLRRRSAPISLRHVSYFSLIGLAFIMVEIVLSQQLVLYLGHPTYALSVVIAGVLLFSGLGSLLSERVGASEGLVLGSLVGVLLLLGLGLAPLLDATLHMSFGARLGVTAALLAPLGTLMGFPFPMGMRQVREQSVPILWAANGFFSVVGTVLAVIISINLGFRAVLVVATTLYAIAGLAIAWGGRRATDPLAEVPAAPAPASD